MRSQAANTVAIPQGRQRVLSLFSSPCFRRGLANHSAAARRRGATRGHVARRRGPCAAHRQVAGWCQRHQCKSAVQRSASGHRGRPLARSGSAAYDRPTLPRCPHRHSLKTGDSRTGRRWPLSNQINLGKERLRQLQSVSPWSPLLTAKAVSSNAYRASGNRRLNVLKLPRRWRPISANVADVGVRFFSCEEPEFGVLAQSLLKRRLSRERVVQRNQMPHYSRPQK